MIEIRVEHLTDHESIEGLIYRAFLNHPQHVPGAKPTEHFIVNALRREKALHLSLVAIDDHTICGHIAFSKVKINGKFLNWYGLGPVAVLPDLQGNGIGAQLIKAGMMKLREEGANGIVLVGDPAYYSRFGFNTDTRLKYEGLPPEYFLVHPFYNDVPSGNVAYHAAFAVTA